jgi:mono/diheme cytochrome c family protein
VIKLVGVIVGFSVIPAIACGTDAPTGARAPTAVFDPTPAQNAEAAVSTRVPSVSDTPSGSGGAAAGDAGNGETLFNANGCSGCHSTGEAALVGPGLGGISDRVDADYIQESIVDPGAVVVDGFANIMPSGFGDSLYESEITDIVAYLSTLK